MFPPPSPLTNPLQREGRRSSRDSSKQSSLALRAPYGRQNHPLFHPNGKARCILVDSEPKVIARTLKQQQDGEDSGGGDGKFQRLNALSEQHGRGNNWALGYYGPRMSEGKEGSLLSRTLECLRREAERCDSFEGCFLWSSLCGGTGSGLGSRLVAEIRSEYPRRCLLSATMAPFRRGELPLQHYNAILASAVHQW